MSFRALRRMSREVDEQHRASMKTIEDDLGELHFGVEPDLAASRRSFLKRAATGGTIAFGAAAIPVAAMVQDAFAQDVPPGTIRQPGSTVNGTTPGSIAGSTTTTLKPKVIGNDLMIVIFAQTVELAAASTYQAILDTGKLDPPLAEVARMFRSHHLDHAAALKVFAGVEALDVANQRLLDELIPKVESADAARDKTALMTVAHGLEEGAAATYLFALGSLDSWEAAGAVSTILPIEAQHAVVLSQVIVPELDEWASQIKRYVPDFQGSTAALDPAEYLS